MRPVLRPARLDDVPVAAALWEEGWHEGHDGNVPDALVRVRTSESFVQRLTERVRDTSDVTVAETGGVVAGFIAVAGDEVEQVYVGAEHRGSGVAVHLLTEAARQVRAAGHPRAWLAVAPGNARARRFYEREGWHPEGIVEHDAPGPDGPIPVPVVRFVLSFTDDGSS